MGQLLTPNGMEGGGGAGGGGQGLQGRSIMDLADLASGAAAGGGAVADMGAWSVKQLKSLLQSQRVDTSAMLEKAELLAAASALPPERDLRAVRRDIAAALHDPGHDDGSLGPLMIRFAWHCCGTFDKATGTGGSNGGTMRMPQEQSDPENAGLGKARDVLEGIHNRYEWLSLADLYVLAGTVAIEASGGPAIPFATGRLDYTADQAEARYGERRCPFGDGAHNPCGSRLPSADLGPDPAAPAGCPMHKKEAPTIAAMRGTFTRLGFDDKEAVCLVLLGHQFGRCHPEASGYAGSWYGFDPAHWNIYVSTATPAPLLLVGMPQPSQASPLLTGPGRAWVLDDLQPSAGL